MITLVIILFMLWVWWLVDVKSQLEWKVRLLQHELDELKKGDDQ